MVRAEERIHFCMLMADLLSGAMLDVGSEDSLNAPPIDLPDLLKNKHIQWKINYY